jgi:hypothetical protein
VLAKPAKPRRLKPVTETPESVKIIPFKRVIAPQVKTIYDELQQLPELAWVDYLQSIRNEVVVDLQNHRRQRARRRAAAFLLLAA